MASRLSKVAKISHFYDYHTQSRLVWSPMDSESDGGNAIKMTRVTFEAVRNKCLLRRVRMVTFYIPVVRTDPSSALDTHSCQASQIYYVLPIVGF